MGGPSYWWSVWAEQHPGGEGMLADGPELDSRVLWGRRAGRREREEEASAPSSPRAAGVGKACRPWFGILASGLRGLGTS